MNQITIVGMGPGSESYLTMEAFKILTAGETIYLRTERHPVVDYLVKNGMIYTAFDDVYESTESFDETYEIIAERILKLAAHQPVVYAVPGNPFVAEKTVELILEEVAPENVKIIHGVSFLDAIITALHYDPVNGFEILDALQTEKESINNKRDRLMIQVYNSTVASNLKLKLMERYPDNHKVIIINAAGIPELEKIVTVSLYELDHYPQYFDHLTSLFIPSVKEAFYNFNDLLEIMRKLRSEHGCPWDREQTHQTLTRYLVEEAYEVLEAVNQEDDEALIDELGDVLLQVVFHAVIGEEEGYFNMDDITQVVSEKMIRRHPHVFGNVNVENSDEVLVNWQAIKAEEKNHSFRYETMEGISHSIPSTIRSQKVQKIASNVGFDWQNVEDAMKKVDEELNEFKHELTTGDKARLEEELGDLLLILTNVARHLKIDAEIALAKSTDKFISRFKFIELKLNEENLIPSSELLDKMDKLWGEAKNCKKL